MSNLVDGMTKRYETKIKIVKLLNNRNYTMAELSRMLGLAESTVSDHLIDLMASGEIHVVENHYLRRMKYYALGSYQHSDVEAEYGKLGIHVAHSKIWYY